jgi:hypothetical protein
VGGITPNLLGYGEWEVVYPSQSEANAPALAGVDEALVDLLGHAEAVRALWYDLFLGIKKGTAGTEHMFLTDSAKQLVAEAGACAALMSSDASQLFEFAKESGLLASPA